MSTMLKLQGKKKLINEREGKGTTYHWDPDDANRIENQARPKDADGAEDSKEQSFYVSRTMICTSIRKPSIKDSKNNINNVCSQLAENIYNTEKV